MFRNTPRLGCRTEMALENVILQQWNHVFAFIGNGTRHRAHDTLTSGHAIRVRSSGPRLTFTAFSYGHGVMRPLFSTFWYFTNEFILHNESSQRTRGGGASLPFLHSATWQDVLYNSKLYIATTLFFSTHYVRTCFQMNTRNLSPTRYVRGN